MAPFVTSIIEFFIIVAEISHMHTLGHDIFPEDYVRTMVTEENQYMEAFVKGILQREKRDSLEM
jgi:hypothetical protein